MASIPLSAKNQVLGLLRDKDEVIHGLRQDKERLQGRVTALVGEGDAIRRQLATLDRVSLVGELEVTQLCNNGRFHAIACMGECLS